MQGSCCRRHAAALSESCWQVLSMLPNFKCTDVYSWTGTGHGEVLRLHVNMACSRSMKQSVVECLMTQQLVCKHLSGEEDNQTDVHTSMLRWHQPDLVHQHGGI